MFKIQALLIYELGNKNYLKNINYQYFAHFMRGLWQRLLRYTNSFINSPNPRIDSDTLSELLHLDSLFTSWFFINIIRFLFKTWRFRIMEKVSINLLEVNEKQGPKGNCTEFLLLKDIYIYCHTNTAVLTLWKDHRRQKKCKSFMLILITLTSLGVIF